MEKSQNVGTKSAFTPKKYLSGHLKKCLFAHFIVSLAKSLTEVNRKTNDTYFLNYRDQ